MKKKSNKKAKGCVRFTVEVTQEEDGDFRAVFIEGPPDSRNGRHLDLMCWDDLPCVTPGEALERIGKQLDAELLAFACEVIEGK